MNTGFKAIKMIIDLFTSVQKEVGKPFLIITLFPKYKFLHCFRTPLHADVYGSFSWSANVVGKKRWLFFPPGEELKLKAVLGVTTLPRDLGEIDLPAMEITYYDLVQNAGEIVFVPSGWHHQVWNLVWTLFLKS